MCLGGWVLGMEFDVLGVVTSKAPDPKNLCGAAYVLYEHM